jgi:hypothetical protein
MIRSEKKLKNLDSLLKNEDDTQVAQAIEVLRDEDAFEGAVGLLTSCYNNHKGNQVKKAIEEFMYDLKDQSLSKEVMEEIKKDWKPGTITMLISSCWQSGLDYSEFTRDLIEIFLKSEYETAIECFTVVEESIPLLSRVEKNEILELIDDNPVSGENAKKALTIELISLLGR